MTIFDVSSLNQDTATALTRATLEAHPLLQTVYDDGVIANLVRRRASHSNYLLFLLTMPEDERSRLLWGSIENDLTALEENGALSAFKTKMRLQERPKYVSWRTELWFAASIKRNGIDVQLEPSIGNEFPSSSHRPIHRPGGR
jgi:hypothetical protein